DNSLLGSLTYTYDAAGNRTQIGGQSARTGLPVSVSGNMYDLADELKQWGSNTAFSYDGNGNLLGDGSNTYHWNKRNQLDNITGSVTASFTYDALGRRLYKTVRGVTTTFLYDGLNPVQESSGGTVTNVLTGFGIDE